MIPFELWTPPIGRVKAEHATTNYLKLWYEKPMHTHSVRIFLAILRWDRFPYPKCCLVAYRLNHIRPTEMLIYCSEYSLLMPPQKTFIRKIKQGNSTRYAEVWNERRGKKVIQHYVRYLGSDPDNLPPPKSFSIEKVHFGYLAQLILNDALTAEDIFQMLDGMGENAEKKELRSISIRYNLDTKKTRLHLTYPPKKNEKRSAQSADDDSQSNTPTNEK